jgi:anti-anti-sigma regulatory factor
VNPLLAPGSPPAVARRTHSRPQPARLALPAELTATAIDRLRDELYRHVRHSTANIILDGRDVRQISAAGVGVLIAAALLARTRGTSVCIARPSDDLRRALRGYAGAGLILEQPSRAARTAG